MLRYVTRRFLSALLSLFIIITTMFCLLRLMPIEGYLGANWEKMSEEVIAAKLAAKGLDKPVIVQLFNFYKDLLHGDLGRSWIYRENVEITKIIQPKIKVSAKMGVMAMALSLLVGIPLGAAMARSKGKWPDKLGTGFIILIQAVPSAVYFLFIQMYATKGTGIPMLYDSAVPLSWVLPIISLALPSIASYGMWMRRYMVDQMNLDYIRLARAKGMTSNQVAFRHVMRNAFIPMAQSLPTTLLFTISGSLYVESLFSIPGMGGLLIISIQRQDNTMVQAMVLLYSIISVTGLLLGDLTMMLCDPRISLTKKGGRR